MLLLVGQCREATTYFSATEISGVRLKERQKMKKQDLPSSLVQSVQSHPLPVTKNVTLARHILPPHGVWNNNNRININFPINFVKKSSYLMRGTNIFIQYPQHSSAAAYCLPSYSVQEQFRAILSAKNEGAFQLKPFTRAAVERHPLAVLPLAAASSHPQANSSQRVLY